MWWVCCWWCLWCGWIGGGGEYGGGNGYKGCFCFVCGGALVMLEDVVVFSVMLVLSVVVFGVALLSWWRFRGVRLVLVVLLCGVLLVQSVVLSVGVFVPVVGVFSGGVWVWLFEVVVLGCLYVVAVKP